ncbi:MAG: hypothetical protein HKO65_06220 [Gemmatimonadetes bacterium]|nr:hypothetical protein [Gemmatimonadota bacterium]NNM04682.1 hypothetical protein [Gemmatimonadota bacterium]
MSGTTYRPVLSRPVQARAFLGLLCGALVPLVSGCGASDSDGGNVAMLLPETIGDWVKQPDPVIYDRETIFDYINGAGEVYRSYAFSQVLVERYETQAGLGVTVEVFDMGTSEDAFGVFSYAREDEESGIGSGFERKGSVLCFWQGRHYVCVAAEQRDENPGEVLGEVAAGISGALPQGGARPALMSALPEENRVPFSDRYFHTHQSLNYHRYLARENVLRLSPETDVALARYQPGSTYLLVAKYEDEGVASEALSSFGDHLIQVGFAAPGAHEDGGEASSTDGEVWASASRHGRFVVAVLDADSEEAADRLRLDAVAKLDQIPG